MNQTALKPDKTRIKNDIEFLADNFTDKSYQGYTRRAFTTFYKDSRVWLKGKMEEAGLKIRSDRTANLIGRLEGNNPNLSPIVIGSHTDTVLCGGKFDGILGVIAGLEVARVLKDNNLRLEHPLEIIDFTSEESSDFGISTIGSRGMVGNLSQEMFHKKDHNNRVLSDLINELGGNAAEIANSALKQGNVALYLELHIEQGPVLEAEKAQIGVVTGIVGILRYRVTVTGIQNHAGTTPMNLRKDALTAASEIVLALEKLAQAYSEKAQLVATVGKLNVEPNSANVIPGKCVFELEARALDPDLINTFISDFQKEIDNIRTRRGIQADFQKISESEPVIIPQKIQTLLFDTCSKIGETSYIQSGAGHDANQMAKIAPISMLFVPSIGGRSHCPEEESSYDDISLAVEGLINSLMVLDKQY